MSNELLIPLGTLVINEEEVLNIEISEGISNASEYHGEYNVTPKVIEQELKTKSKLMSENIIVKKIPYSSVDNLSGGQTLTIGG